jgi:hypothetical protein
MASVMPWIQRFAVHRQVPVLRHPALRDPYGWVTARVGGRISPEAEREMESILNRVNTDAQFAGDAEAWSKTTEDAFSALATRFGSLASKAYTAAKLQRYHFDIVPGDKITHGWKRSWLYPKFQAIANAKYKSKKHKGPVFTHALHAPLAAVAKPPPAADPAEPILAVPPPALEAGIAAAPPFPDDRNSMAIANLLKRAHERKTSKPVVVMPALVGATERLDRPSEKKDEKGSGSPRGSHNKKKPEVVTPRLLYDLVRNDNHVVQRMRRNLLELTEWKLAEYKLRQSKAEAELASLKKQAEDRKIKDKRFEDEFPEAAPLANLAARLKILRDILKRRALELRDTSAKAIAAYRNRVLAAIVDQKQPSIMSVKGDVRAPIRSLLSEMIYSLQNGWKQYQGLFQNVLLLGGAGVGKTTLARVIANVLTASGILATDVVKIVTKSDLVSMWVGQTGKLTLNQLIGSLDGVLFIDEAYELAPDPKDVGTRDHGKESITEIVNFLDKYVGMSVVIAAGYEEPMMRRFIGANEGMNRRFPYRMRLPDYSDADLAQLFITMIEPKVDVPISQLFTDDDIMYIYDIINTLRKHDAHVFSNQAGDMLNIAGLFLRHYFVGFPKPWRSLTAPERKQFLRQIFTEFAKELKFIPVRIAGNAIQSNICTPSRQTITLQWSTRPRYRRFIGIKMPRL